MCSKPFWTTLLFCIANIAELFAQQAIPNNQTYQNTVDFFNTAIGPQAEIFNGPEYEFYPTATRGTGYFQDNSSWTSSLLKYNGTWYKNVPIVYDTYKDVLVTLLYNKYSKFVLAGYQVSDFYLHDHYFVRIDTTNCNCNNPLKEGFYEQVYNGKTQVLVKWSKTRTESTALQDVEVVFKDVSKIFIKRNNQYYSVGTKSAMLDLLKDKKKELIAYLKTSNIDYNADRILSAAKLAAYYDKITE